MIYLRDNPVQCRFCNQHIINQYDVCELCNVIYITNSKNIIKEVIVLINDSVRVKFTPHMQKAELLLLENNYFRKIMELEFKLIHLPIKLIHNKVNSILPFI